MHLYLNKAMLSLCYTAGSIWQRKNLSVMSIYVCVSLYLYACDFFFFFFFFWHLRLLKQSFISIIDNSNEFFTCSEWFDINWLFWYLLLQRYSCWEFWNIVKYLTCVLLNKDATPTSNFQPIRLLDPDCWYKYTYLMANSADPDQLASLEANWSGSTLFAKAGYIWVQQD